MEPTAAAFVSDVVYAVVIVFVIVSALGWIGFDTTSFAAVIAAAGLAIGLALQGSLSNFASGLLLIVFKPFRVGDSVEISASAGTVEEVHVFSTVLRTADNVYITVPNSQITQTPIKNYSASPRDGSSYSSAADTRTICRRSSACWKSSSQTTPASSPIRSPPSRSTTSSRTACSSRSAFG